MFGRLMPTEGKFFDLFNQHAALCVKGAQEMVGLMTNFDDLEMRTHAIEGIEKEADKVTYACVDMLHKTFITPIDREDIHKLITRMDDILDLMEDAAQTVSLYDLKRSRPRSDCCTTWTTRTRSSPSAKRSTAWSRTPTT